MDERKISLLENMTVARGASPNEERIAQEKIAKYSSFMAKPKEPIQTQSQTWNYDVYDGNVYSDPPIEEQRFRMKWEQVKRENRKKWGID